MHAPARCSQANYADVDGVQALLLPLEKEGILVQRSRGDLEAMMPDFIVIERETKLMGCAMLLPLGKTVDGVDVAEIGAFCVDPVFRCVARGGERLDGCTTGEGPPEWMDVVVLRV